MPKKRISPPVVTSPTDTTETPKRITAARLDADGYFAGMDELPETELTERHLPNVSECDLPPGKYRWIDGAFVHAPKPKAEDLNLTPHAERAIVKGFEAVMASGIKLPPETVRYVEAFKKTVDYSNSKD